MKSKYYINCSLIVLMIIVMIQAGWSQNGNVGIGSGNPPTRARLEVFGAYADGFTSAIFAGDTCGISMQRYNPAIGFNEYRPLGLIDGRSPGKYMANGYAAIQSFNPSNGTLSFYMYPNGSRNTFVPLAIKSLNLFANGSAGIHTDDSAASLVVGRGTDTSSTAKFSGSQFHSTFNMGSHNEDTYINGGKSGSRVVINDIPGGIIKIGGGDGKMGINLHPNTAGTSLQISGAIAILPVAETLQHNEGHVIGGSTDTIIVGNRSFIEIYCTDHGVNTISPNVYLTNGINIGQMLIISGAKASQNRYFNLISNSLIPCNVELDSDYIGIRSNDTITLIWNGTSWLQVAHGANY